MEDVINWREATTHQLRLQACVLVHSGLFSHDLLQRYVRGLTFNPPLHIILSKCKTCLPYLVLGKKDDTRVSSLFFAPLLSEAEHFAADEVSSSIPLSAAVLG